MPEAEDIPLGLFGLRARLAEGGMGEVWRAVHRARGLPVAVKVLKTEQALEPWYLEAFRAEVRAMAALSHPGVVVIYDHGAVSDETARLSSGRFVEGSPYVVMELLRGPLGAKCGRLTWSALASVIVQVLQGLAHAHARGVIHRDVKPQNILVASEDGADLAIKLVDFGIAHLRDDSARGGFQETGSGTPGYAAPEQMAGAFRDYGPWTDLYAVGQSACRLAWGLHAKPQNDAFVPDGFREWLARMMMPEPSDRFACAADAVRALKRILFPVDLTLRAPDTARLPVAKTRVRPSLNDDIATQLLKDQPHEIGSCVAPTPRDVPIVPEEPGDDWIDPGRVLWDTGLSLYALRTVPLVGRAHARRQLWKALVDASESRNPKFRLLLGPAGVGKSRLAEWLCQRAHELGAATPLVVRYSEAGGPKDGFAPMIARILGIEGLDDVAAWHRVHARFSRSGMDDSLEIGAFVALADVEIATSRPKNVPLVRLERQSERHATLARLLERLSAERPVLLWLDDVQWGHDALAFCVVLARANAPIAVVLTAREEERGLRRPEFDALDALANSLGGRFDTVAVAPLDRMARRILVRKLLGLKSTVAAEVEERTAGNPLFAVQLVGDWVQRGLLVRARDGFGLKRGARPDDLPPSLQAVCRAHLDRLLEGRTAAECLALEAAGALGSDVDESEWTEVCEELRVPVPRSLLETMLARNLARRRPREKGFSFIHAMLQESLILGAQHHGRAAHLHAACAGVLERRRADPARVARHRMAAQDWKGAVAPLEQSFLIQFRAGDLQRAEVLLETRREILPLLGTDRERAELFADYDELLLTRGLDWESYDERIGRIIDRAIAIRQEGLALRALLRKPTSLDAGTEAGRRRLLLAQRLGENGTPVDRAKVVVTEAMMSIGSGNLDVAEEHCARVLDLCGTADPADPWVDRLRGQVSLNRAQIALQRGDLDTAREGLATASEIFSANGDRDKMAVIASLRGVVARAKGDFDTSEREHRIALRLRESTGRVSDAAWERCQLALLDIARCDWTAAEAAIRSLLQERERPLPALLNAMAACVAMASGRTDSGKDFLHVALGEMQNLVNADFAWLFERIGDLADKIAENSVARRAWAASLAQWERLGRSAAEARVREKLFC